MVACLWGEWLHRGQLNDMCDPLSRRVEEDTNPSLCGYPSRPPFVVRASHAKGAVPGRYVTQIDSLAFCYRRSEVAVRSVRLGPEDENRAPE